MYIRFVSRFEALFEFVTKITHYIPFSKHFAIKIAVISLASFHSDIFLSDKTEESNPIARGT